MECIDEGWLIEDGDCIGSIDGEMKGVVECGKEGV